MSKHRALWFNTSKLALLGPPAQSLIIALRLFGDRKKHEEGARSGAAAHAIVVLVDGVTATNRDLILKQVAKHRLPAMYQAREFLDAGGQMSYA